MKSPAKLLTLHGAAITPTGATFPELTLPRWRDLGRQLATLDAALPWARGDWFLAGQAFAQLPPDQFHTPEEQARAIARLLPPVPVNGNADHLKTLYNYAWVCRKFPHDRRRPGLSFSHHSEVASLDTPAQDQWLDRAAREQWTVPDLRAAMAGRDRATPAHTGPIFVPRQKVNEVVRWFAHQFQDTPLADWPKERRDALKREFQPLVDILNAL